MVGLGAALQVAGVLMYKSGYDEAQAAQVARPGDTSTGEFKKRLGIMMVVGGFGVAVPGTISWIKGSRLQTLYKDYPSMPTSSLSFRIGVNPAICYRF